MLLIDLLTPQQHHEAPVARSGKECQVPMFFTVGTMKAINLHCPPPSEGPLPWIYDTQVCMKVAMSARKGNGKGIGAMERSAQGIIAQIKSAAGLQTRNRWRYSCGEGGNWLLQNATQLLHQGASLAPQNAPSNAVAH